MTDIIMDFDSYVFNYFSVNSFGNATTEILKFLSLIGTYGLPWVVFILLFFLKSKDRINGFILASAMIVALILNNLLLKNIVARPRPFVVDPSVILVISAPPGFSFASGHAATAFAAAVSISKANRIYALWAFPLASAIAFSRIYFSVHFASDVIAGAILGIVCGLIGLKIGPYLYATTNKFISNLKNHEIQ